ncbi:hypothetical protein GQ55_1G365200 [Panicum hallii var. hallii]|uniref:Xaa-Pro dipeptidyl-peptidase-like domain-containing protein n=1 Tax=Panicum hallii var. hallii TaxID=1504633 RepID=A0A2T7FBA1_9POAL|nr:hypothetical protein GQ55_1G365200 [Panicum hallii var. hallii]
MGGGGTVVGQGRGEGTPHTAEKDKKREEPEAAGDVAVVMVHPYTILGGVQGLLRGMAEGVARRGYTAVTFDMRGAGRSTGRASLTGSTEVGDVAAVCRWVAENIKPRGILLVGSSAGAAIAGSAVDKVDEVIGYVSIGYPFSRMASVLFGRHHDAILKVSKAKAIHHGNQRRIHKRETVAKQAQICSWTG